MDDMQVIKDIDKAGFDAVLGSREHCEPDYLDDYFIVAKNGLKGLYKYNLQNNEYELMLSVAFKEIDYFKMKNNDLILEVVFAYKKRGKWWLFYDGSLFNHKLLGETFLNWYWKAAVLLAKRNGKKVLYDFSLMIKGFQFEILLPNNFEYDIIDFGHNDLFCWIKKEKNGGYAVFSKGLVQITEFLFDDDFTKGIDGSIHYSIKGKSMKQPSIFHFHKHYALLQQ